MGKGVQSQKQLAIDLQRGHTEHASRNGFIGMDLKLGFHVGILPNACECELLRQRRQALGVRRLSTALPNMLKNALAHT